MRHKALKPSSRPAPTVPGASRALPGERWPGGCCSTRLGLLGASAPAARSSCSRSHSDPAELNLEQVLRDQWHFPRIKPLCGKADYPRPDGTFCSRCRLLHGAGMTVCTFPGFYWALALTLASAWGSGRTCYHFWCVYLTFPERSFVVRNHRPGTLKQFC